jgi:hypothetical protein
MSPVPSVNAVNSLSLKRDINGRCFRLLCPQPAVHQQARNEENNWYDRHASNNMTSTDAAIVSVFFNLIPHVSGKDCRKVKFVTLELGPRDVGVTYQLPRGSLNDKVLVLKRKKVFAIPCQQRADFSFARTSSNHRIIDLASGNLVAATFF